MKVLSIKEPWATLIRNKDKYIETRSWKTNYRGELYIHASLSKISKETKERKELMEIVGKSSMSYGRIICKCNLVDCKYMDEDFLKEIKKNKKEYVCGEYKLGRYAWILKDIKKINPSIEAKGKLNIWTYNELT